MVEAPASGKTSIPPYQNNVSPVIFISNLVRPFTVAQLKRLLQRTGQVKDLWIDPVKSKCLVMVSNLNKNRLVNF